MQKIPTLFKRNHEGDRLVRDEVTTGAEWVMAGAGIATRKIDGTSCRVLAGKLWKRHDVKNGRVTPDGWEAAQEADPRTGHHPGWVPVGDGPEDKWHREALKASPSGLKDGTYELIGPKVQGNPEQWPTHALIRHGSEVVLAPRTYAGLKKWLEKRNMEGVVWWHLDGRMAKVKTIDFGLERRKPQVNPEAVA